MAKQLESEAKVSEILEKEARIAAKRGPRNERAQVEAKAESLKAQIAEQKRLAKENKKAADALKHVENYEKYLATKEMLTFATEMALGRGEALATEAEREANVSLYDKAAAKNLSKSEKKALATKEREHLLAVIEELEAEAMANEEEAKATRAAIKKRKRSNRIADAARAEALKAQSAEQRRLAKENKKQADALKHADNYEKYLATKEMLAIATEKALRKDDDKERECAKKSAEFADVHKHSGYNKATVEAFCREHTYVDESMVERRYGNRAAVIKNELALRKLRFGGKKTRGYKKHAREVNSLELRLKSIEKHLPAAIKSEKLDNERYTTALRMNVEKLSKKPEKVTRLAQLQAEIERLLEERDRINKELLALYNNDPGAENGRDKNLTASRLDASKDGAKAAHKEYKRLARDVGELRFIPANEKDEIFDLMNRTTKLNAEISELKHRIKKEKVNGRAKRLAKKALGAKQRELKIVKNNLHRLSQKAKAKSKRAGDEYSAQIFWITVLVLAVVIGALAYFFRAEIFGYLEVFVSKLGGMING